MLGNYYYLKFTTLCPSFPFQWNGWKLSLCNGSWICNSLIITTAPILKCHTFIFIPFSEWINLWIHNPSSLVSPFLILSVVSEGRKQVIQARYKAINLFHKDQDQPSREMNYARLFCLSLIIKRYGFWTIIICMLKLKSDHSSLLYENFLVWIAFFLWFTMFTYNIHSHPWIYYFGGTVEETGKVSGGRHNIIPRKNKRPVSTIFTHSLPFHLAGVLIERGSILHAAHTQFPTRQSQLPWFLTWHLPYFTCIFV